MGSLITGNDKEKLALQQAEKLAAAKKSKEKKKAAGTTAASTKYYSKPENMDIEIETAAKEMETKDTAVRQAKREERNARKKANNAVNKYNALVGQLRGSHGEEMLRSLKTEADTLIGAYDEASKKTKQSILDFESSRQRYNEAVDRYNQWKSTIRRSDHSEQIGALTQEKELLQRQNDLLQQEMGLFGAGKGIDQEDTFSRNAMRIRQLEGQIQALIAETPKGNAQEAERQLQQLQKQIGALENANAQLNAGISREGLSGVNAQMTNGMIMDGRHYSDAQIREQIEKNTQQIATLRQQAQELETQKALYEEEQEWAEYFRWSDHALAEDFDRSSGYRSTANGKKENFSPATNSYIETGYDDILYELVNKNPKAAGMIQINAAQNPFSFLSDMDMAYIQTMTNEEVKIYNYLYAREGKEKANEYLSYLTDSLKQRNREGKQDEWKRLAQQAPATASALTVLTAPARGIGYLAQGADYLLNGRIDENAAYNNLSHLNSAVRGEVSQLAQENWGPVGSFAYQTGMSMADFLVTGLMGGSLAGGGNTLTLALMGSGAAADATIEAKDRGLSDSQAFTLGTVAGLAEIVTEKVSLDALLGKTKWSKTAIGYWLSNTIAEAGEEGASSLINLTADILVSKDQSQWQQSIDAYREKGLSEQDAFIQAMKDQALSIGLDMAGGALSGGLMAIPGTVSTRRKTGGWTTAAEEPNGEIRKTLLEAARQYPPNAFTRDLVSKLEAAQTDAEALAAFAETGYAAPDGIDAEALENARQSGNEAAAGQSSALAAQNVRQLQAPQLHNEAADAQEMSLEELRTQAMRPLGGRPLNQQEQQKLQRLQNASTRLEITGVMYDASEAAMATAQRLSQLLGRKIEFFSEAPTEHGIKHGKYVRSEDTIYVNTKSRNPVASIIGHELTHSVELADAYQQLARLVRNRINESGGSLEAMKQEKAALYKRNGEVLNPEQIEKEIVAEYVEKHLLTDEQSIRQMVRDDRGTARKILDWLDSLLARLGNKHSQERQFILQARNAYRSALAQSSSANEIARNEDAMRQAWAEGNDELGDALFEETYDAERVLDEGSSDGVQFSIGNIEGENDNYGIGVVLDTNLFDGEKPRHWGKVLSNFVYRNLAGTKLTVYDDLGNAEVIHLARIGDRVTKDGAKNSHKVIDKLARVGGDNIKALATVHLSEMLETSRYENTTSENNHQWLDEKGWEHRKTYLQDAQGNIYEATLNIANGRDRRILYSINNIRQIDKKRRTTGGAVPSAQNGRGSHTSHSSSGKSVPQKNGTVKEQYMFSGPEASGADMQALDRAKQMEAEDVDAETIRQQTGWFRGADGKWRWEIDDSSMRYHRAGDAHFSEMHPEYARHQELMQKFLYGELTAEEEAEFRKLDEIWGRERQRLSDRVSRGNAQLQNLIRHNELFENYPWLRGVNVKFGELPEGTRGQWDESRNTITISEELRNAPESTLLHEIQHAIQDHEGFSGGASAEFWKQQRAEIVETISGARRNLDLWLNDIGYPEQLSDSIRAVVRKEKTMEQHWQDMKEFKENSKYARQIAACEAELAEFQRQYDEITGGMTVSEQYFNTAGEIEARDTARRRDLSEQQRRQTQPDLGDENTVFANQTTGIALDQEISEYPYSMQTIITEYLEAVDDDVLSFVEEVVNGDAWNGKKIVVGKVSGSAAEDIRTEIGVDVPEGAQIILNKNAVEHIKRRHGEHGNGDHSMANNMDIARIGYVLKNYDSISDGGRLSNAYKNSDHSFARTIVVSKKINGTYYIVEAVPDTGKIGVLSAYINKNGASQVPDAKAPSLNAQSGFASAPKNKVTQYDSTVKEQFSISEPEVQTQEEQTRERDIAQTLPAKARPILKRAERTLLNKVARSLSVPYHAQREFLKEIVRRISTEYLQEGRVRQETVDSLFETAYEQGVVVDREFYDTYKPVKDYLRTTELTLSEIDREDIPDYDEFKKRARYVLRLKDTGGLGVDSAWRELQEMAPALFPDRITHPADQLQHMYDVANSIRVSEKKLNESSGHEAEEFKRWARNDFNAAIYDNLQELVKIKRYADADSAAKAQQVQEEEEELSQKDLEQLYQKLKQTRKNYEKILAKTLLTDSDMIQVGRLLRGELQPEHLRAGVDDVEGIMAVYEAKAEYEKFAGQIRRWNKSRKSALLRLAEELTSTANDWKDKRFGITYSWETMERNVRDIIKDPVLAQKIIDTYFKPVHDAAAKANKLKNQLRDQVRALNISRKVMAGNTISEAAAVQLLGEAEDNIRVIQESRGRIKVRDGKTAEEWQAVIRDMWEENPNLDKGKVRRSVEDFRKIYDELFQRMNESRIRNGYEPVNYRQGYFPHFQAAGQDGILGLFGKALGIETEVTALPTTINGLTHTFKPGIRWMANAQERKGFETVYDAVEGFDKYIEGVADVIYQTDNIQRLRALASQIRYRTSDEGIRKQVDEIRAREDLSDKDKDLRIDDIYKNGKFALSNFVVELDEYTNLLANKKSRADRNMEQAMGRDMYNLVKAMESRVAANMVAINPASWLTNFIPLTQGAATLDRGTLVQGMWQTLQSRKNDDGIVAMSSFLTNRRGSDPLVRTWAQQASATMSKPMEWIDSFTADSLVRARYQQNLNRGLSQQEAISEADQWAAGVMADRSKGATPTLFNRSNPLTKLFTQFQLEVKNQLSYVFKDIPREAGQRDKYFAALAAMLLKFAIEAFLFNEVYEWFIGRRPALDPIGILNDTVGDLTGYELPNLVDYITGKDRNFRTQKVSGHEAAANLWGNIAEELPFIGGLMGGGRLPISSALPDAENLSKAMHGTATEDSEGWSGAKRWATGLKEAAKPLTYMALPFGGGQLKKIYEGVKAVAEGGSYTVDSEGNDILQYPIYSSNPLENLGNYTRAMLFGKSSLPTAQEWVESGFQNLGAKQTAVYKSMVELGVADKEAFELLQQLRGAEKTETESEAMQERRILQESTIPGDAKAIVYYTLMSSDEERELMDALEKAGADMGEVTSVLIQIKDVEKTKAESESMQERRILQESTLSGDAKAIVYYMRMSSDKEQELMDILEDSGADMGKVSNTLMQIKDADAKYDGAKASNAMRDAIAQSGLSEKDMISIYRARISDSRDEEIEAFKEDGLSFKQYLEVNNQYSTIDAEDLDASAKATLFARWVNNQDFTAGQEATIKESFKYWQMMPATAKRYEDGIAAGLSDERAYALTEALGALEPVEGKSQVSDVQKWRAAVDLAWDAGEQMQNLYVAMEESDYRKMEVIYNDYGIEPAAYVKLKEILPQFDANGNGSYANAEVTAAIDSICTYNLAQAAIDKSVYYMTPQQKAALWQMVTTTKSAKNNPYSSSVGWDVLDKKATMKETKEEDEG